MHEHSCISAFSGLSLPEDGGLEAPLLDPVTELRAEGLVSRLEVTLRVPVELMYVWLMSVAKNTLCLLK